MSTTATTEDRSWFTDHAATRTTDVAAFAEHLRRQHTRAVDIVAPAAKFNFRSGQLVVSGLDQIIEESGVTNPNGTYEVGAVAIEGLAEKFKVPLAYLRRIKADRPDIFDLTLNRLMHGLMSRSGKPEEWNTPYGNIVHQADARRFMVRCLRGDDGNDGGFARAWLSDSYKRIDHYDVLMSVLQGVRDSGHPVDITRCDLTERSMYVRVRSQNISVLAPELLAGYRSPYTGQSGDEIPQVDAGFAISNSEVGDGRAKITPYIVFRVCKNGMLMTKDAVGATHLGSKVKGDGIVRYSDNTIRKELELVKAQTADAVATFLDTGYVAAKIREISERAATTVDKPQEAIATVAKALSITEAEQDLILSAFVKGGQMTAGGVMQAVTAVAQDQSVSADRAFELEAMAMDVLALAAAG